MTNRLWRNNIFEVRWVELLLSASFPPQDYLGTEYLLLSAVQVSCAGGVNNTNTPPVHQFGMWAFQHFIIGHSVGGGAPFIPLKAASCCLEAKKTRFPGYENTWIADRAG